MWKGCLNAFTFFALKKLNLEEIAEDMFLGEKIP
jgi:hypothetical protein